MEEELTVKTNIGTLTARKSKDMLHPGLQIFFLPKGSEKEYRILQIEVPQDPDFDLEEELQVLEWFDPSQKQITGEMDISLQDFLHRQ